MPACASKRDVLEPTTLRHPFQRFVKNKKRKIIPVFLFFHFCEDQRKMKIDFETWKKLSRLQDSYLSCITT